MNQQNGKRAAHRRGQPGLRALTSFDALTADHKTFLVEDDASAPHLQKGEYAVIDTTDRISQHGELYVIQYESGERQRKIVQVRSDQLNITGPGAAPSLVWWIGDLRGCRQSDEVAFGDIPVLVGLSDGPYQTDHLQSRLIGRIVGVSPSDLGGLIAPAAGWLNEAAGNAAFDAAEYVDVLVRTGHRPIVLYDEGKPRWYFEEMPNRRETKAERVAMLAVRKKYCAASTALERVIHECVGRGLVDRRRAA